MITPSLPADEAVRVQVLRDLKILDTPPEERFDRITRLAKRLFKVDWAVVSLVDTDRAWVKSAAGWEEKQSPRNLSFCAHAILAGDLMVVADALVDPRFSDHPAVVQAPHIRFYAGMPLSGPGGAQLGTLCILDGRPRRFTEDDAELLKDLAVIVQDELNNAQLNQALSSLKESESAFEDLLENVGDMIVMGSVDGLGGRVLFGNRTFRKTLGYSEEEIRGMSVDALFDPKDLALRKAAVARMLAGEELHGLRVHLRTKDGRTIPAEATANVRFKDGKPAYARVSFNDITARLQIEQMKNEAVSLASHELRQPLTVINTALEALDSFGKDLSPEETKKFLQTSRRAAGRLLDMVNLYLDLAKLESGSSALELRAVDLPPLIKGLAADASLTAAKTGVRYETAGVDSLKVKADPTRLVQVVTNLVSNATKFSPPNEAVTISWARADGEATISVSDRGPGISPEFRSKIFGKFAQDRASDVARAAKGTGLGLSIAKTLVEKMGGRIGFETEAGKGTTFRFTVPLA